MKNIERYPSNEEQILPQKKRGTVSTLGLTCVVSAVLDGGPLRFCKGRNKDGSPCRATPLQSENFCFFHSPTRDSERKAAKSKAGKVTALRFQGLEHLPADHADVALKTVDDAKLLIERLANWALKGTVSH